MPYSIEKNTEFLKTIYWGTLTNNDIRGVLKNGINDLDYTNRIEDMRKLEDVSIGFKELLSLTQDLEKMELTNTVRVAVLTGSQLQYGIARMFQTILDNSHIKIQIFKNEEEALIWISSGK